MGWGGMGRGSSAFPTGRGRGGGSLVHELLVTMHVVLAVEGGLACWTDPLGLLLVDGALMREEVGTQAKRESALVATERTLAIMDGADVCFQMRLGLEFETTTLTWKLTHFFVDNLPCIEKSEKQEIIHQKEEEKKTEHAK